MTQFTWSFSALQAIKAQGDLSDVVVSVRYRLAAVENESAAYKSGTIDFAPADPDAFIEFNAITKDDMISFVEQSLGSNALDAIKADLHQALTNPIELRSLPWESQAEAIE